MDMLLYISEGGIITPVETVGYALIITLLAFRGANESCLVNTFSFACYWGFKGFLESLANGPDVLESMLSVYFIAGLAIFASMNFYYFTRDRDLGRDVSEDQA